jgi:hypothetical protein
MTLLIGCLLSASGCKTRSHYTAIPMPFDRNELVDFWIGFNNRDATFYKLILQPPGDGVLYSQFQEGKKATNKIVSWRIQGNVMYCDFQFDAAPTSPALLTCEIKKALLAATLTGVGGWKEKVQFRRIQFIEESVSKAKMLEPGESTVAVPYKE